MASPLPYTIGTVTLEHGSTAIEGNGTTWKISGVSGGVMTVEVAGGNPLLIASVEDDTTATAATRWMGPSGTYSYAISLASAEAADTVWANRHWSRVVGQALLSAIPFKASGTQAERDALSPPLENGEWFGVADTGTDTLFADLKVSSGWRRYRVTGPDGAPAPLSGLSDLSDVTLTAPATGKVLRWSDGRWRDAALAASDVAGVAEHIGDEDNPHAVTKAQVGLGNADNTADADKPVSGPQFAFIMAQATAEDYFAAMTTPPSVTRRRLVRNLVASLASQGVWDKLDLLYLLAAHDEQVSRINLRRPGWSDLTAVNSPTFEVDLGWSRPTSQDRYLTPGIAWDALGKHSLDSAHIGVWINAGNEDSTSNNQYVVGQVTADIATLSRLRPRGSGRALGGQINDSILYDLGAIDSTYGHLVVSRTSSSEMSGYRNAESIGSRSSSSVSVSSEEIAILKHGNLLQSNHRLAAVHIGSGLSEMDTTILHAALSDYLVAIGGD